MLKRLLAVLFVASSTVATAAAATPPQNAALGEDDFRHLVRVDSPALSPDGKYAVVPVSRANWDEDRYESSLVLVDVATGQRRTLTYQRKGLGSPKFSPDGTRLAFVADDGPGDDAQSQVFVMPLDGGDPTPVTHAKRGVELYSWRPDGRAIAYVASDAPPERKGADRFRDSFLFTTEPIVAHGAPPPRHVFVVPLEGREAEQLTAGSKSACGDTLSWSPDGKTLAFTLCRNAILNDEAYSHAVLVDVATKTLRSLTDRTMWESDPAFSPDGKHVAYLYSNGDGQIALSNVYVTTPGGGAGTNLTSPLDRPIGSYAWAPDSHAVIASAPSGLTNALYRVPLAGARQRLAIDAITPGIPLSTTGGAGTPDLSEAIAKDGTIAFVATSPSQPAELFVRNAGGAVRKLTDFNAYFAGRRFANAEAMSFPTTTGVRADGVLYLPPGFVQGRTYPAVVYIHGGPTDPTLLVFDFWAQVMAARGWIVVRPNYRGSPNLGYAYQHAVLYDPEDGPGKDIVAALDSVRARGIVDERKIAVCGWSYGGIMTAWLISKYHFWNSAVSGASVNDWLTDYGTADDSMADADLFHGSPFVGANAAEWRRASAIQYVADVTTPVLILSDVGDNRDPFATSSMYWRALRDNQKEAELRVWPVAGHFPSDPVRAADVYQYWIDFIARHFEAAGRQK